MLALKMDNRIGVIIVLAMACGFVHCVRVEVSIDSNNYFFFRELCLRLAVEVVFWLRLAVEVLIW